MSFLQDPKVYKSIVEGAIKTAQVPPRPIDANTVAKKLTNNLSRELSGSNASENVTAADNVGVTMDNLYSLPALLQFLSTNKVKVDGKQVVYTQEETAGIADPSTLSQVDNFFIDGPTLARYMSHLQEKAKADNNPLLQSTLITLINQINTTVPNAKIEKKQEKSTPENPNVLDDNTILDKFSKKVFDVRNPMANTGNDNLLLAKHLKSAGTLNAWLRDIGGSTVIMYDGNQPKSVSFFDEHANRCIVPQVLYKRALQFYNTGDENQRRVYGYYMRRVQEIAGQFTGPNNEACTIEGAAPVAEQAPGAGAGQATVSDSQLIQSVPLRMRDLSFQRIKDFFAQYQKFFGSKRGAGVQTAINNALETMRQVQTQGNMLNNPGMDLFNLNAGPEEVKNWLLAPQGRHYIPLLDHLESIIVNTGYVLRDLQTAYGEKDIGDELKNILGQQIGYGSGSGSIYGNNLNQIARLKSLVRNV